MKFLTSIFIFLFLFISKAHSDESTVWLKNEIDNILDLYKNKNISKIERFQNIEQTINKNFAGAGIGKFVAGKAWATANKQTKKKYIALFKRHLALNIASIMEGYSDQSYELIDTKHDTTNDVTIIDMELQDNTNKILVSWRVKKANNKFYVIDLMFADISLVVTKRSEFNSMLKKINYDLEKLNLTLQNQNETIYKSLIQ